MSTRFRRVAAATLSVLFSFSALSAQTTDSTLLSVQRIYGSADFRPKLFGPARWLADGASYSVLEDSKEIKGGQDIVRYDAASGTREIMIPAAKLIPPDDSTPLSIEDYGWSPDGKKLLIFTNSKPVWRQNNRGDYWVLNRESGRLQKLGGPKAVPSSLLFAKFSPDGRRVGYVRERNLYIESLQTGRIIPLTRDGSRSIINGTFDWVYEEELHLRDGWRWSPDGRTVAFWQLVADSVRDFNIIDNTDSLYSTVTPVQYPKAGESNSAARVGVVPAAGGPTRWFSIQGDRRNHYIARMDWASSSDQVVIQYMNRLQNTIEVLIGDRRTGQVRPVLTEHDSTWVEVVDPVVWLDGGSRFTWVSERDGWTHVYLGSRSGGPPRLITPGDFDVRDVVGVDEKEGWLYYMAAPENVTQRYLYRARLAGLPSEERLTPAEQSGIHSYDFSPTWQWAFHTYSRFGVPPVTELVRMPGHEVVRTVAPNAQLRGRVSALRRGPSEFFQVDIGDGVKLNGWIMKPTDFDPSRKYPILLTVYGGPGSQTVLDGWGGSNYLWHLMLTQQGYLVASVDNRGTGGRGRDWRKVIYGQLGVVETRDQAAAAKVIAGWPYVDPHRVGIWGWIYGGFMSLNTLFQAPDVYHMAIAVAPVTHWKFYDNIYSERYNGLPQQNKAGYDKGSPLSYVDQLQGKLLVVHGSGDDNVHFQNTESLVNALVAANKAFSMMEYPNRNHGIFGGNTRVHLFELLTRFVQENLGQSRMMPQAATN